MHMGALFIDTVYVLSRKHELDLLVLYLHGHTLRIHLSWDSLLNITTFVK